MQTAEWQHLLSQPRQASRQLRRREIPTSAGVYAWFKDSRCVYVGVAANLRDRLSTHRSTSLDLSRSTLRASVASVELGVTRAVARSRPTIMTRQQIAVVTAWFATAELTWIECAHRDDADELERSLRLAWLPPLNRA